jgi:rhodanese-related sulfurtransferase
MLCSLGLALGARPGSVFSRPAVRTSVRPVFASAVEAPTINQARASHILVDTEEMCDAMRSQVEGGMSFADIATTVSLCTSRTRGGFLGWFSVGMMAPEFEQACFDAEPDSLVKVSTNFGWHLIHVEAKRHHLVDITPAQLRERMGAGDAPGVQFLDVRSAFELEKVTIPGVPWINLPFNEYSEWGDKIVAGEILDPSKETIVICHHGMRSSRTAQFMLQNGFQSVVSVLGGIDAYALEVDPSIGQYQNEMKGEECSSCG